MNKERLGAFIAGERKALGLTQRDLAARLHVTDKAVSKWERGLSYPDVTLLEPLAAALDLGVEELMACRRQETKKEDDTMKALLDISNDSVRAEKRRGWSRLIAVLVMLLAAGLGILYAAAYRSVQDENDSIVLKESVGGEDYIYIEEPGNKDHLLRLKCGDGVDFDAIQQFDEGGWENSFNLSYRWNRWTRAGVLTSCEQFGMTLGSLMDVTYEAECKPLFGYPQVFYAPENYYPDPYGEPRGQVYLSDARFWVAKDGQPLDTGMLCEIVDGGSPYPEEIKETILVVEDCLDATIADVDGDGENEAVIRTRWAEKPYTVYDMVDGEIVETWPDTVPDEVVGRLWCVWEQQEAMEWSAKHG